MVERSLIYSYRRRKMTGNLEIAALRPSPRLHLRLLPRNAIPAPNPPPDPPPGPPHDSPPGPPRDPPPDPPPDPLPR